LKEREEQFPDYDPNTHEHPDSFFGLPFSVEQSRIIVLPVPWDVTVSYHEGAFAGPSAVKEASLQVDLSLSGIKQAWKLGLAALPQPEDWLNKNRELRKKAKIYIEWMEGGKPAEHRENMENVLLEINRASFSLNEWVKSQSQQQLSKGKVVCSLGGDHSTPFGLVQALSERYSSFGVLQFDAHADLRCAYQGFEYSHA